MKSKVETREWYVGGKLLTDDAAEKYVREKSKNILNLHNETIQTLKEILERLEATPRYNDENYSSYVQNIMVIGEELSIADISLELLMESLSDL